jgi:hypothetical protein
VRTREEEETKAWPSNLWFSRRSGRGWWHPPAEIARTQRRSRPRPTRGRGGRSTILAVRWGLYSAIRASVRARHCRAGPRVSGDSLGGPRVMNGCWADFEGFQPTSNFLFIYYFFFFPFFSTFRFSNFVMEFILGPNIQAHISI